MKTAILRDDLFLAHDTGEGHPESSRRLRAVHRLLDQDPVAGTYTLQPRAATRAEIERVHGPEYVDRVARTADCGRVYLDPDTSTSAHSYEAALGAAGATLEAVELVVEGEADGAFALVRPPGHHAEAEHSLGFCLFNNIALAAAHALDAGGLSRVLLLDPDVHHGNGTQNAFWSRPEVLYVSSHRYPFFPGTGAIDEIGEGPGAGHTVNMPLPAGCGDADFQHLFERIVAPVVEAFEPELILVSAGFDTWMNDPLGGMRQTRHGFRALYGLFRRWAERFCPGRLVLTLEGGYDPGGLAQCVRTTLEALAEEDAPDDRIDAPVSPAAEHVAQRLRRDLTPFWPGVAHARV